VPPHTLRVTKGIVVILLRKLDAEDGLCSGVRCIVKGCYKHVLDVAAFDGPCERSQSVYIVHVLTTRQSPDLPFILNRMQFPLRLACAMAIYQ
jgi:hypothetical protein